MREPPMRETPLTEVAKETLTPEYINAFVDGELAADERARVMARLESDPEFKARACELRTLKDMVKGAYAEAPAAPGRLDGGRAGGRFQSGLKQAMAAGLLLALGLGGGWLARDRVGSEPGYGQLSGLPAGYQVFALAEKVDADKVILHLDSGDPERFSAVLDVAEKLLAQKGASGRVEIVANSFGLNLLRADVTPLAGRIEAMARRHANLSFVACGQTVARLKREGVKVELLPVVHSASSAINEIITLMGQGWIYVKA
ncbi:MAG: hypothetical protein Q8O79_09565 [Pseudomonadota bacterium]|nr:hypothetical protein [Pseudomonadota bacterium]